MATPAGVRPLIIKLEPVIKGFVTGLLNIKLPAKFTVFLTFSNGPGLAWVGKLPKPSGTLQCGAAAPGRGRVRHAKVRARENTPQESAQRSRGVN